MPRPIYRPATAGYRRLTAFYRAAARRSVSHGSRSNRKLGLFPPATATGGGGRRTQRAASDSHTDYLPETTSSTCQSDHAYVSSRFSLRTILPRQFPPPHKKKLGSNCYGIHLGSVVDSLPNPPLPPASLYKFSSCSIASSKLTPNNSISGSAPLLLRLLLSPSRFYRIRLLLRKLYFRCGEIWECCVCGEICELWVWRVFREFCGFGRDLRIGGLEGLR